MVVDLDTDCDEDVTNPGHVIIYVPIKSIGIGSAYLLMLIKKSSAVYDICIDSEPHLRILLRRLKMPGETKTLRIFRCLCHL